MFPPSLGAGTMGTSIAGTSVTEGIAVAGGVSTAGGTTGVWSTGGTEAPGSGSRGTIAVAGRALASPTGNKAQTIPVLSKSRIKRETLGYDIRIVMHPTYRGRNRSNKALLASSG